MLNKSGEVKNEAIIDGKKFHANSFKGVGFPFMVPGTSPEEQKRSVASSREPLFMIDPRGFVLIWRKITETSFYKDSYAYHLASHLLIHANHKDKIITFNGAHLDIKRGQFIAGRYSLSDATGIKPSTVRNKLALLKNIGFLDIKSNNKFSIITICNYSSYQKIENSPGQQRGQQEDNQRTTRGQLEDTNNNDNNDNNEKMITKKTFRRPSFEEVRDYCLERNNGINPKEFIDKNDAIGWVVGKNKTPMKDWKATIRTWENYRNRPVDMLTDVQKVNVARFQDWEKRQELEDGKTNI